MRVIVPSAINLLTLVNEEILAARRRGRPATFVLPHLRHRAWIAVNETGAIPVDPETVPGSTEFTR